jgi:transposase InsO family protein
VRTREGWLYLAIVLDLFSRKVVGHASATSPHVPIEHTQAQIEYLR